MYWLPRSLITFSKSLRSRSIANSFNLSFAMFSWNPFCQVFSSSSVSVFYTRQAGRQAATPSGPTQKSSTTKFLPVPTHNSFITELLPRTHPQELPKGWIYEWRTKGGGCSSIIDKHHNTLSRNNRPSFSSASSRSCLSLRFFSISLCDSMMRLSSCNLQTSFKPTSMTPIRSRVSFTFFSSSWICARRNSDFPRSCSMLSCSYKARASNKTHNNQQQKDEGFYFFLSSQKDPKIPKIKYLSRNNYYYSAYGPPIPCICPSICVDNSQLSHVT